MPYQQLEISKEEADKILNEGEWKFVGENTAGGVWWNPKTGELLDPNPPCEYQKLVPSALKRFVVFTGVKDQCQSGLDSIDSSFDTEAEALARGVELTGNDEDEDEDDNYMLWVEIVDTVTMKTIKEMGYEVP